MHEIPKLTSPLADEVVRLREIAEWDIPEILIAHQDDPMLCLRLGHRRPPTGAQLGSEVERADARRAEGLGISLTLTEPAGNDCRGRLEISAIDWDARSARISLWVAPRWRRRGLADHALGLATRWLTETVGLDELTVGDVVDDARHGA